MPENAHAALVLPDGSTRSLSSGTFRATEYTVGEEGPSAMPGDLPPNVAYTWAVELSLDEAQEAGATSVEFDRPSGQCALVDPAWDIAGLLERVRAEHLTLVGAVATHAHWDHVGGSYNGLSIEGVGKLVSLAKVPVYVHEADAAKLQRNSGLADEALRKVKDGESLSLGDSRITFLPRRGTLRAANACGPARRS